MNDVVLATAAGAIRRYLSRNRGVDLDGARFHRDGARQHVREPEEAKTIGNRVSAWFVNLPISEPDPLARLADHPKPDRGAQGVEARSERRR